MYIVYTNNRKNPTLFNVWYRIVNICAVYNIYKNRYDIQKLSTKCKTLLDPYNDYNSYLQCASSSVFKLVCCISENISLCIAKDKQVVLNQSVHKGYVRFRYYSLWCYRHSGRACINNIRSYILYRVLIVLSHSIKLSLVSYIA